MAKSLVSVIMPVYNTAEFIEESIESILSQTYKNFEFIIVDDGSTDGSGKIIKNYAAHDKRIRVYSHTKNRGLIATLNHAVSLAKGRFIARQDPDDISMLERLAKQVDFLESHPSVGLLGTNYQVIDDNGAAVDRTDVFTHPDDLRLAEIFSNQFGHGTIMARADLLRQNPYDPDFKHAEDFDLWTRLSHITKMANLKDQLYQWRLHGGGVTASKTQEMLAVVWQIRGREFDYYQKNQHRFAFSFHPSSINEGLLAYLNKKSGIYRDMAFMLYREGLVIKASMNLLTAWFLAPWRGKTCRMFWMVLKRQKIPESEYEVI